MNREPANSAKDAKLFATAGNTNQAIAALADAILGIAEYQWTVRRDLAAIKRALNIR